MERKETIHLSLGSNLGDRLQNLQEAVFRLGIQVGDIIAISKVYESPAWGFSGGNFLNLCLSLETKHPPLNVLKHVLLIEESLGRTRTCSEGYSSRTLDIDILYYGNEIINTKALTVPHPQLQERLFVLLPLAEIAPQRYHPVLQKDTRNLLQQCKDKDMPKRTAHTLFKSRAALFSQTGFIAIEGNIGAGKTSLAKKMATDFNAKLILERFAENPFLPSFYKDQARYAFPLEMSFLADRYQQFMDDTSQYDLFRGFMISDYDIYKSLIFAQITLQEQEFELYRKIFGFMYKETQKPQIYMYLYQTTERLLENIKLRGRDYEQNIGASYLEKINRGYFNFLKSYPKHRSLVLDISELDFVSKQEDYDFLIRK
ncbi:MAG: 2-amino-4-hydroxy-6-hydroxymethyldihydropteridine diphosphokinase, partial [Bacteroidota bacterium]